MNKKHTPTGLRCDVSVHVTLADAKLQLAKRYLMLPSVSYVGVKLD